MPPVAGPIAMHWTAFDVADALNCAVYGDSGSDEDLVRTRIERVTIDSRDAGPGALFVALAGTTTHGFVHAADALRRGAVAVLVGNDAELDDVWEDLVGEAAAAGTVLATVDCDGVIALGRLARAWRRRLTARVVGITGSSGKTGTKDLLAAMLRANGRDVVASRVNWNNEIGVPITLLEARSDTDVVVCEMGMRGPGQVAYLCDVADPDVGIVTNVGTAHLELLGSVEAIRDAKAELVAGTWTGGTVVYPADRSDVPEAAARVPDRALAFSAAPHEDAAVAVVGVDDDGESGMRCVLDVLGGEVEVSTSLAGAHHAVNLAAATCGLVALVGSVDLLETGTWDLRDATMTAGRGDRRRLAGGVVLLDDSYNANPESVRAALGALVGVATASRRVAVLGHMAELGPTSGELHEQLGAHAARIVGIDHLVAVRTSDEVDDLVRGWLDHRDGDVTVLDSLDAACGELSNLVVDGDAVLVKASNGAGFSRLVEALTAVRRPEVSP